MKWCFVTAMLLTPVLFAAPARAGTYDVWACRLPDGTRIGPGGWHPSGISPAVQDRCSSPGDGGLQAYLPIGGLGDGQQSGWTFFAPADTEIEGFSLRRAAVVTGDRAWYLFREDRLEGAPLPAQIMFESCVNWLSTCPAVGEPGRAIAPSNTITRAGLSGMFGLTAVVACRPYMAGTCAPDAGPGTTGVIWSSRITLKDVAAPVFTGPIAGTLVGGPGPVTGIATVSLTAVDRGGGIQSVALIVDGAPGEPQPADPGNASCQPPFVTSVPCTPVLDRTFGFDTSLLADGSHNVRISATDVAGNHVESGSYTVVTRNVSVPNGANATRSARLEAWFRSSRAHRTATTVGFNRRRTVDGRLIAADGAPIASAILRVTAQATRPGSRVRSLANVVTDAKGRFRFLMPRGSSRSLHLGYRAFSLDQQEAAGATLSLNVRAGVRLNVSPRRVRNGTTATFSGRLLGGPGQFGTQVTIYALSARRPIPVETVPADRRGRFRYRYRFSSISGHVRFRFQAVVKSQPNYPYARGGSAAVTVRARP